MRVRGVELVLLELAMRRPMRTAAGTHRARPVAYIRVVCDEAEGWGECAALAEPTAVDPALGEVWEELRDRAVPRLLEAARARGGELPEASVVAHLGPSSPAARLAGAALEMAVLDAELRRDGRALWERLGVDPAAAAAGVAVGELVGIPDGGDLGRLIGEVAAARERAARVRLKVGPGWDAAPVEAVRTAFPDLALQVDANGAYRLEAAGGPDAFGRLADLDRFGLACIEQPLAAADLAALAEAARRLTTPVGLDESLSTPRRLADALRYGACEVAVLKPGRLGGLLAARRCAQRCADAGVPAFVGGFFDTGLARAANAALAALPGFTLPGDLSDPAAYLAEDPVAGPVPQAGRVALYAGPGVAPLPDPALVAARTVLRARLGP